MKQCASVIYLESGREGVASFTVSLAGVAAGLSAFSFLIGTGVAFQISDAYCLMVRSLEKNPGCYGM